MFTTLSQYCFIHIAESMKNVYLLLPFLLFFMGKPLDGISQSSGEDKESGGHAYSCAYALSIHCGYNAWINTPTQNELNSSNYNLTNCVASPGSYNGRGHMYRLNVGTQTKDLTITVSGLSANMDLFVFKNCSGSGAAIQLNNCVAYSVEGYHNTESVNIPYAVGEYYVVVDGRESSEASGYQLSVYCGTSPNPHGCTTGTSISCGDVLTVQDYGNNTYNATNYDVSACDHASYDYNGTDHVFQVNVGHSPKNVTLTMSSLWADMDMFLFRSCSDNGGRRSTIVLGVARMQELTTKRSPYIMPLEHTH